MGAGLHPQQWVLRTPPGLLREPGSARNFSSERVPPGLPRKVGSTHDPNRQEDLSRTSTEIGLRPLPSFNQQIRAPWQATKTATTLLHFLWQTLRSSIIP